MENPLTGAGRRVSRNWRQVGGIPASYFDGTAQLGMHNMTAAPPRTWSVHSPTNLELGQRSRVVLKRHRSGRRCASNAWVPVIIKSCRATRNDREPVMVRFRTSPNSSFRASRIASDMVKYGVASSHEAGITMASHLSPMHECNLHECMFLETLRGQPGIPRLFGGWFDGRRFKYVVSRHGDRLCDHVAESGLNLLREQPFAAAQSLLRCFQSFAELGDYYLMDFNCKQFTVAFEHTLPVVYLIDAPLQRHGLGGASGIDAETPQTVLACSEDDECRDGGREARSKWLPPGLIGKTFDQPAWCEKDAIRHGSLVSRGGHCKLSMAHYSSKTHVVDVARHHFMLPFFLDKVDARVNAGLRLMIGNMSLPRQQRPSFSHILESLAQLMCEI